MCWKKFGCPALVIKVENNPPYLAEYVIYMLFKSCSSTNEAGIMRCVGPRSFQFGADSILYFE